MPLPTTYDNLGLYAASQIAVINSQKKAGAKQLTTLSW